MSLSTNDIGTPGTVRHAGIGKVHIGREGDILQANLGSCLGIAIGWPDQGVFGLAHVLLPEPTQAGDNRYGRYAVTAVRFLLRLMKVPDDHRRHLSAVLAGGAAMYGSGGGVGEKNVVRGTLSLREANIRLVGKDVRGTEGRRIIVDCATHMVQSVRLGDDEQEVMSWTMQRRTRR